LVKSQKQHQKLARPIDILALTELTKKRPYRISEGKDTSMSENNGKK